MRALQPGARPTEPRLGIDIGRVIIVGPEDPTGQDTGFFDGDEAAVLATPEVPDAVETIGRLVALFDGKVWLVSKCGDPVEQRTRRWLDGHDFYRRTHLPRQHVRFCRARADKRRYCLGLGLTHFVDDQPEVHAAIRGAVSHQYLFGTRQEPLPGYVTPVSTWCEAERLIRESLGATPSR